jgi:ribosome-associated protein
MMTEPVELARRIAEIASDSLAAHITVLDISQLSQIADVFVICSADNARQLTALREAITGKLKDDGVAPRRVEGVSEAGWIVLDYGDVIVHLFTAEVRAFYQLESVWSEAQTVLVIQ